MISHTLTRSNRKTMGIYIKNGVVEVRAPLQLLKSDIDRFIMSKERWISDKLNISQKRAESKNAFAVNYDDMLLYRGIPYPLKPHDGTTAGFSPENGGFFYVPKDLEPPQIKDICIQIYRILAKVYLDDRVTHFSKKMNTTPTSIKINSAKTRWGSCSSKKSLNFSWRLIMANDDVIDYVVVHELAHTFQMNHSSKFWAIVQDIMPNYRLHQARLKELQRKLSLENW